MFTDTGETENQQEEPPHREPHHTQARQPLVPYDICPQYGIISTVRIPAVSSGATCTLSLRNFLWSCKTQVQSTYATKFWAKLGQNLHRWVWVKETTNDHLANVDKPKRGRRALYCSLQM